ncbi:MAG TPA: cardiolipin synthase [Candidatus Paceibacterota bacterium]|nr:cardiolipin synthase [Candidatus Paceibacterota bacterium]
MSNHPEPPDDHLPVSDSNRWSRKTRRRILISSFVVLGHLLGFLSSVNAIMTARTAQGAVAWAVSLNTFPYLAVPAYWIFGRSKFQGYVIARRAELAQVQPMASEFVTNLIARNLIAYPDRKGPLLVERLSKLPFTQGYDAELLVDGDATFRSIFEGISRATNYVLVQFYIIRDDGVGRELKSRLSDRAKAGVRCFVLYDEIGSKLPRAYLQELTNAGVRALPFNSTQGKANRFQLNFRNHRKIVVVDGQEAWVGGLNIGDEYRGLDPKFGYWRDTHLRLSGPIVPCVQVAFLEDWQWASHELLRGLNWDPRPAASGISRAMACLPSGPADPLETCTLFFLQTINLAQKRLWIASPYFVPDEQFISGLQLAALRGVDVRILIPDKTDNPLVQFSAWSYVKNLELAGIKVYRYTNGFMHHKILLGDDQYCTIGTANFDNRSFRLNFEITMAAADTNLALQVASMLEKDFDHARPATTEELLARGFWYRFAVQAARLTAPIQ